MSDHGKFGNCRERVSPSSLRTSHPELVRRLEMAVLSEVDAARNLWLGIKVPAPTSVPPSPIRAPEESSEASVPTFLPQRTTKKRKSGESISDSKAKLSILSQSDNGTAGTSIDQRASTSTQQSVASEKIDEDMDYIQMGVLNLDRMDIGDTNEPGATARPPRPHNAFRRPPVQVSLLKSPKLVKFSKERKKKSRE